MRADQLHRINAQVEALRERNNKLAGFPKAFDSDCPYINAMVDELEALTVLHDECGPYSEERAKLNIKRAELAIQIADRHIKNIGLR